jgi:hypothetical protein
MSLQPPCQRRACAHARVFPLKNRAGGAAPFAAGNGLTLGV